METFFDVVKILSHVMDLVFVVVVIVLIKRYSTLRKEVDYIFGYLIKKGNTDIARNEADIARDKFELAKLELTKRGVVVTPEQRSKQSKAEIIQWLFDYIKPLIGNTYIINVYDTASNDLVTFKIFPKGSNEDSGFVISFFEIEFNYTEAKSELMKGLVMCGYLKIPIVNE